MRCLLARRPILDLVDPVRHLELRETKVLVLSAVVPDRESHRRHGVNPHVPVLDLVLTPHGRRVILSGRGIVARGEAERDPDEWRADLRIVAVVPVHESVEGRPRGVLRPDQTGPWVARCGRLECVRLDRVVEPIRVVRLPVEREPDDHIVRGRRGDGLGSTCLQRADHKSYCHEASVSRRARKQPPEGSSGAALPVGLTKGTGSSDHPICWKAMFHPNHTTKPMIIVFPTTLHDRTGKIPKIFFRSSDSVSPFVLLKIAIPSRTTKIIAHANHHHALISKSMITRQPPSVWRTSCGATATHRTPGTRLAKAPRGSLSRTELRS